MEGKHSSDLKGGTHVWFYCRTVCSCFDSMTVVRLWCSFPLCFFPQAWLMATAMCSDADAPVCANKHSHEHKHREIQSVVKQTCKHPYSPNMLCHGRLTVLTDYANISLLLWGHAQMTVVLWQIRFFSYVSISKVGCSVYAGPVVG